MKSYICTYDSVKHIVKGKVLKWSDYFGWLGSGIRGKIHHETQVVLNTVIVVLL